MQKFLLVGMGILLLPVLTNCVPVLAVGAAETGSTIAEERTTGNVIDDRGIYLKIQHYFVQSPVKALVSNIDVRVYEGRVLLTGRTPDAKVSEEAVRLSWLVSGVREVLNEVTIGQPRSFYEYSRDNAIEAEIDARLIATKNIKSLNFPVEVAGGVAYVLGTAQDDGERQRVLQTVSYIKGVNKVVSFIRLRSDPARPIAQPPADSPS